VARELKIAVGYIRHVGTMRNRCVGLERLKMNLGGYHCMHGSAMQVVIGHIAFKGEMANFDLSYLRHR
jgi:hypothetical protein